MTRVGARVRNYRICCDDRWRGQRMKIMVKQNSAKAMSAMVSFSMATSLC